MTGSTDISVVYNETAQLELGINGPVSVDTGGTGKDSSVAYAVQCGGTTTTAPLQSIASVGTSGQALTSNGSALPSFQSVPAGAGGTLISTVDIDDDATVEFTSGIDSTYNCYLFFLDNLTTDGTIPELEIRASTNAGSTWLTTSTDYSYASLERTNVLFGHQQETSDSIETFFTLNIGATSTGSMWFYLFNPSSSAFTFYTHQSMIAKPSLSGYSYGGGAVRTTTPIDGIQLYGSTANIKTGTVKMYGITKPT